MGSLRSPFPCRGAARAQKLRAFIAVLSSLDRAMLIGMDIAIIGGGITGLTTAIALKQQGIDCQVYERAPQLNEVGAGIGLAANAMRVLEQLGLAESIRALGMPLGEIAVTDPQLEDYRGSKGSHAGILKGHEIIFMHRARLQRALFEACVEPQIHLGACYGGHRVEGDKVVVNLGGEEKRVDLLLGADGIHSGVRKQLFPESRLRYSGQSCWRGVAQQRLPEELGGKFREAWGEGLRFGFGPIGDEEVYWFAVQKAPEGGKDDPQGVSARLKGLFSSFHPFITELIDSTPTEKIIRSDIHDLARLERWHRGPVALIGDAAHATTPNMGQGACQGIEDAWFLSQAMSRELSFDQAFAQFENDRRAKVDYVVNNSWRFGQMAHNPAGRFLMRTLMKLLPESATEKQMQRLLQVEGL